MVPLPLYFEMKAEAGIDPRTDLSFPEVMTAFEDAYGRAAMVERIKKHLDMVKSFPKLDQEAGSFHRELSGLFTVTEIFTTNWDDYFERECGAQPFLTEKDWAYWKSSDRKVFKLHGSISSPGSIVATQSDYEDCYRRLNEGLVGARLKMMLATKTVVFVGYSLSDSDLVALYELINGMMGEFMPRAYVVTPDDAELPEVASEMHVIRTSGMEFLRTLKSAFSEEELVPDDRFEAIPYMRELVGAVHHRLVDEGEMRDDPAMYMCACYQDGLTDAFDHQMANAAKGPYHHRCHTERMISEVYADLYHKRVDEGAYETAAYIHGFISGLEFLIGDDSDRKELSPYYVYGMDGPLKKPEEYEAVAEKFAESEPTVYEYAKKKAAELEPGIVFHHLPFL